ncbi:glycosyltransferase family 4 protein [Pseudohoeflea suaedae]|nr:glycosyltransferase family 4 protein [Pseudohoeflea suaedae]
MTLLHLSAEMGWRGGENQLALIYTGLQTESDQMLMVRRGSELERRMRDERPVTASRFGLTAPRAAWSLRRKMLTSPGKHLIHAHCGKSAETALLARFGTQVPLVISRRSAYPIRSHWKFRAADAVIAVSRAASEELLKAGVDPSRIHIIPDAVDAPRFAGAIADRRDVAPDEVMVLCAAALSPEKDHEVLLKAWKQVEEAGLKARLLMAGTGSMDGRLKSLAGSLDLRHVSFLGWVENISGTMAAADIAVLSSRVEGLASFLCEAQFCGIPVVSTAAGGTVDAVRDGETGFLSPTGDENAFAENLTRLIRNSELRAGMGAAARTWARRKFALEPVLEAHRALYRQVLDGDR